MARPMLTATSGAKVKLCKALHTRRGREKHGMLLLEGERLVCDYFAALQRDGDGDGGDSSTMLGGTGEEDDAQPPEPLVMLEAIADPERPGSVVLPALTPALATVLRRLPPHCVMMAAPAVVRAVATTVTPAGVVAAVAKPRASSALSRALFRTAGGVAASAATEQPAATNDADATASPPRAPLVLVLDGVADPGNLGTLVRTAAAVGAEAVVLFGDGCADAWAPKCLRSAMGATFRVPIIDLARDGDLKMAAANDWPAAAAALRRACCSGGGSEVVEDDQRTVATMAFFAADGGAEGAREFYDADWRGPCALVVGAEARGLSASVRAALATGELTPLCIPLDSGVESLNAAVAGSVMLCEAQRQRRKASPSAS